LFIKAVGANLAHAATTTTTAAPATALAATATPLANGDYGSGSGNGDESGGESSGDTSLTTGPPDQPFSFDLDMASGVLRITFPTVVQASSLIVTGLALSASASSGAQPISLTAGSAVSQTDSNVLFILLSLDDMRALKAGGVGVSHASVFLFIDSPVIDLFGDLITLPEAETPVPPAGFKPDNVSPVLQRFSFIDLAVGQPFFELQFSEAVVPGADAVQSVTLQARPMLLPASSTILRYSPKFLCLAYTVIA